MHYLTFRSVLLSAECKDGLMRAD